MKEIVKGEEIGVEGVGVIERVGGGGEGFLAVNYHH